MSLLVCKLLPLGWGRSPKSKKCFLPHFQNNYETSRLAREPLFEKRVVFCNRVPERSSIGGARITEQGSTRATPLQRRVRWTALFVVGPRK